MFDFEDIPETLLPDAFTKAVPETSPGGLEVRSVAIGDVRAVVRTPAGMAGREAKRASAAVVMCAGNPVIRKDHAGKPVMLALDRALDVPGVATVRFDFAGVGMSAPSGPSDDPEDWRWVEGAAAGNARDVVKWARTYLSDCVVVCGWNYGSWATLWPAAEGAVDGFISIAFGYNVWLMYPKELGEALRDDFEMHSKLECKALYVLAEKDTSTPRGHVRRLTEARPDGGAAVEVQTVKGAGMEFAGQEGEVGTLVSTWLHRNYNVAG